MNSTCIWSRFPFLLSMLVTITLFLSGCSTAVNEPRSTSVISQDLTDAAIERYIRTHPEVIVQSLQALEVKHQAELRERQKTALAAKQNELLHDPASPVSGNLKGEITLVEFYDYRCGFCKQVAPAVTELQKEDPRVRVVYKDFPILGEPSELAAKAALASQTQGKHQAFHEALLASHGDMTKEAILKIAVDVGLDAKRLEVDMANPEWLAVIEKNRTLAQELSISGTPGFIVGTELVPGALDLNGLKELIARASELKR
ncbi:MAG: DsbA family protein [Nitrospira sp.]|nr:DsbA family protein [Nitrospira sp.]